MSQEIFDAINPSTTSGTQLADILNDFKDAIVSGMSGTARPTELEAGGGWVDMTDSTNWIYKVWTGTTDVAVFTVNTSTGKSSFAGSDSTFEISRFSADAVGPIAKLTKRRTANNGQVLASDVIGEFQFIGRGNDSSNPVVARMRAVASENMTSTASGSYIVIETTPAGQTAAAEVLRVIDGKLGVGTTAPNTALHVQSSTGIKSAYAADSANGAKMAIEKERIAGTKATQSADDIGQLDFNTTDSASAKATSAQIKATALEAHTGTARGTKLTIATATTSAAAATSKLEIGDKVESIVTMKMNSQELVSQSVATTATIAQLSAAKAVVEFTGSTATSVQGINSGHASKVILLHNLSTADITLQHENASATAADRLKLPNATSITIAAQTSIELFYSTTDSRWKLKSGSGSGTGSGSAGKNYTSLLYPGNSVVGLNTYNDAINLSVTSSGTTVDELGDVINISAHGLTSGQPLLYSTVGGVIGGLVNGSTYYAWVLNSGAFGLALTRSAAIAGTPLVDLTSDGTGVQTFTALTFPSDGTGGTVAGLTTALNTTTPLRGTTSQRLSKDAANRQGSGWSYDFTLDRADYEGGKPVLIQFRYKTSANYVSGDLKVNFYDKDGNALSYITNGTVNKSDSSSLFSAYFYPASADDDYRLTFHIATANALAWDFDFIDLSVSPTVVVPGIDYITQTSKIEQTASLGQATLTSAWTGSFGSGVYSYASGVYTMLKDADVTLGFSLRVGTSQVAPQIAVTISGVPEAVAISFITGSTAWATSSWSGRLKVGDSFYFANVTAGNSDQQRAYVIAQSKVSNVISTAETLYAAPMFKAHMLTNQAVAANGVIKYDTVEYDDLGAYSTATGLLTAKRTGRYKISGRGNGTAGFSIQIRVNGAVRDFLCYQGAGLLGAGAATVDLIEGQTLGFHADQATTINGGSAPWVNSIEVEFLPKLTTFGVYGNFEILSASSNTKTPTASGNYSAMVGNSLALTPGTWRLFGTCYFSQSGTAAYTAVGGMWFASNGTDTTSGGTLLTAVGTVLSAGNVVDGYIAVPRGDFGHIPVGEIVLRVTAPTTVYLVPYAQMTTAANARLNVYANALRLQ